MKHYCKTIISGIVTDRPQPLCIVKNGQPVNLAADEFYIDVMHGEDNISRLRVEAWNNARYFTQNLAARTPVVATCNMKSTPYQTRDGRQFYRTNIYLETLAAIGKPHSESRQQQQPQQQEFSGMNTVANSPETSGMYDEDQPF